MTLPMKVYTQAELFINFRNKAEKAFKKNGISAADIIHPEYEGMFDSLNTTELKLSSPMPDLSTSLFVIQGTLFDEREFQVSVSRGTKEYVHYGIKTKKNASLEFLYSINPESLVNVCVNDVYFNQHHMDYSSRKVLKYQKNAKRQIDRHLHENACGILTFARDSHYRKMDVNLTELL